MADETDLIRDFTRDGMRVLVYGNRTSAGRAAGLEVARAIRQALSRQERVRMVFAAAPSQCEMLAALAQVPDLRWDRVTAFHMDEYIGIGPDHPASFAYFLQDQLFERVHPGCVHLIDGTRKPTDMAEVYTGLVSEAPIDIVCLGIGENGHLAFNDPGVARFDDPVIMKEVNLDEACRLQQVHDGCFPRLADVPERALTLTIPALLAARTLICTVPGQRKRTAVGAALCLPVDERVPATSLRTHPDVSLYLDAESGADFLVPCREPDHRG
ncbi:MAG: 6-phosphogluconolactonase [Firmicutes bacterium]|nr:6-phosphogluconolactonase [Bacillota bacterium]